MSSGLIRPFSRALHHAVEICSISPETNVALSDGGRIAYTTLNSVPAWSLTALSQEHGLLGHFDPVGEAAWDGMEEVDAVFKVGQTVLFEAAEASLVTPEQRVCYVVADNDIVLDVWHLW